MITSLHNSFRFRPLHNASLIFLQHKAVIDSMFCWDFWYMSQSHWTHYASNTIMIGKHSIILTELPKVQFRKDVRVRWIWNGASRGAWRCFNKQARPDHIWEETGGSPLVRLFILLLSCITSWAVTATLGWTILSSPGTRSANICNVYGNQHNLAVYIQIGMHVKDVIQWRHATRSSETEDLSWQAII